MYGGLTPEILDGVAGIDSLCKSVARTLERIYNSELEASNHLARLLKNHVRQDSSFYKQHCRDTQTKNIPAFCNEPMPSETKEWKTFQNFVISNAGVHRHTFTCRKNVCKKLKCREAYAQRPATHTHPVILSAHAPHVYHQRGLKRDEHPPIASTDIPTKKKQCTRDIRTEPIPVPEHNRCIYWDVKRRKLDLLPDSWPEATMDTCHDIELENKEQFGERKQRCLAEISKIMKPNQFCNTEEKKLIMKWLRKQDPTYVRRVYNMLRTKLQNANQYVVQHNDVLSNTVKFNTNVVLLGSRFQSVAAMFYLTPYLAKSK